jgi:iron complex transport system ATP-binding protein
VVRSVGLHFGGITALDGVDLAVKPAEIVGVLGPNGAGKTTLLRAMAGLVPFSGYARVEGSSVSDVGGRSLAKLVAYVPQRPQIPVSMSVTDYVLLGRTPYIPYLGMEGRKDMEVVAGILDRLDLVALARRPLGSLSGGEIQRAVLGRALAQEAPVLLLDEPTAALDVGHQQQVLELVDELRVEHRLTVVSAMHDLTLAGQFAQELLLLDGGRAVASGPAGTVLTEAAIRRHYGAVVRILEDPDGGLMVLPTRRRREGSPRAKGHAR